eukprot:gene275-310_t
MTTGLSNKEKASIRQRYAQGKATRDELLEGESQSYHGAGTCTFYGTANSNQMLMEVMGLHLPGAAFTGLFPRSRTVMMPGVGHLPMLEQPRRTAQDYLDFRRTLA